MIAPNIWSSPSPSISVIIPTVNEMGNLKQCITAVRRASNTEIIVVDGKSTDKTREIALALGVRVIGTDRSRGLQMNLGAEKASSEILLFLHADTLVPTGFSQEIRNILKRAPGAVGAFGLSIEAPGIPYRIIEFFVGLRSRYLKMVYGDQAIFTKRETFRALGGFPDQPFMEDLEFIRQARRRLPIIVSKLKVRTSARRWQRLGPLKTTLLNQLLIMAYLAGVSPENLSRIYYRKRRK